MARLRQVDVVVALAAFVALCVAVLTRTTALLEPDDLAYRASIVALAHGHLFLSTEQYTALGQKLGGIAQWTQQDNGRWLSEKNPGYPFFAVPFYWLGIMRLAPLFYGGLACAGLYAGARRWLGRLGGAWAVVLYCSSGAALVFAWRDYMPTFTDASLVAAGAGALLWAVLASDASPRRRTVVGLLAFLALEGAAFIRYTDGVALLVAVVAVAIAARRTGIGRRALVVWGASVVAFCGLVAVYDDLVYGGVLTTGYRSGEIQFGLSAIGPNLREMPRHLFWSMPLLVLAFAAVVWIGVRLARRAAGSRRDAAVGATLLAVWLGVYGLYLAYTWTATVDAAGPNGAAGVHVIRFYVPALGALALLGAWLVRRLPRWLPLVLVGAVVALGGYAYPRLADVGGVPALTGRFVPLGPGPHNNQPPPGGQFPGGRPPRAGGPPPGSSPAP